MKKLLFISLLFCITTSNAQKFEGKPSVKILAHRDKSSYKSKPNDSEKEHSKLANEYKSLLDEYNKMRDTISYMQTERELFYGEINKFKRLAGFNVDENITNSNVIVEGFDEDLNFKVMGCFGEKKTQTIFIIFSMANTVKPFHQEVSFGVYRHDYGYKRMGETILDDLGYNTKRYGVSTIGNNLSDELKAAKNKDAFAVKFGVGSFEHLKNLSLNGNVTLEMDETYTFAWGFKGLSPLVKEIKKLTFAFETHNEGRDRSEGFTSDVVDITNIPVLWID